VSRIPIGAISAFPLSRCNECGGVSVTTTPSEASLAAAYVNFDAGELARRFFPEYQLLAGQILKAELARSYRTADSNRSFLDYGCGGGHFLAAAGNMGYRATGMELDTVSVEEARTRGLDVVQGVLPHDRAALGTRQFDVVKCMHVIEHVPAPHQLLMAFRELITNTGVLLLGVPNQGAFPSRLKIALRLAGIKRSEYGFVQPPIHLHGFTPATLVKAAEKAGFAVLWMEEISPLDPAHFPATSEYWSSIPLQRVVYEVGRFFGSPGYLSAALIPH
jgi:2-polyprenyl-3-methyl-5-hydroxy-6-metoxy-1,4-benzoquinol methylase